MSTIYNIKYVNCNFFSVNFYMNVTFNLLPFISQVVFGLSEPHKLNASIQHFKVYIKLEPPRSKKAHADVWVVPKPTLKKESKH